MERATLEIRDYKPSDRGAVIDLLSQGRSAHYRSVKELVFDWQFGANPHDDGGTSFLVGTADGNIVALLGFMPVKIRYKGHALSAVWICDIYVSSEFRNQGFGTQLALRALKRAPILLGFGISDMSERIMERGSTLCADNRILFFYANEAGIKGTLKNLRTRIARLRGGTPGKSSFQVSRHEGDFGAEFTELWQRSAPGYDNIVERDAALLNWKYRQHPLHRYLAYTVREGGKLRGLLVARHNNNTSLLIDYSGPATDNQLMSALVAHATADLVDHGTQRVRCEASHPAFLSTLERCGYVNSRYRSRFRIRTNVPNDDGSQDGWFIISGDSDGDVIDDGRAAS